MSKITVAGVRQNVKELLDYSNNEKKRNFLETVEVSPRATFASDTNTSEHRLTTNSSKSA
jgi:ribosomal protein L1